MLTIRDGMLYAQTKTLSAVIKDGAILSLRSMKTGTEFISNTNAVAMELVYALDRSIPVEVGHGGSVDWAKVNDYTVEMRLLGWMSNAVVMISEDLENGDLLIAPSAYTSMHGVRSLRWSVMGINPELDVVAPLFQGVRLRLDDPILWHTRSPWPREWEAGFSIFQGAHEGFWVWTQDTQYRYKSIKFGSEEDPFRVGFEAETYGPLHENISAGGLTWRVGVFEGDWHVPAQEYKTWMEQAWQLDRRHPYRPDWVDDLTLCVCWAPLDEDWLDNLARFVNPKKTLLHIHRWRSFGYDQNYPLYEASPEAARYFAKAQNMGYHIAPHTNIFETDPSNPAYELVGQFEYRDIDTDQRFGWSFTGQDFLPVPMSNRKLLHARDTNTMTKIHPGQPMWASILREQLQKLKKAHHLDAVFTDVSHNTFNLYNCLVNNTTSTEGAKLLQDYLNSIDGGLALGGEGLNEITMQSQAFSQVHLFKNPPPPHPELARCGGIDLGHFLWGDRCRMIGYSKLEEDNEWTLMRMRNHIEHGCIPTITGTHPEYMKNPNKNLLAMFDLARQL